MEMAPARLLTWGLSMKEAISNSAAVLAGRAERVPSAESNA
jgi:hypothetical protein